jgi:hypothetical protein
MQTRLALAVPFAALFTSFASTPALADTPLGAYVGAAIGTSLFRTEDVTALNHNHNTLRFHQDDVAWKGFVGIRLLPLKAGCRATS